MTNSGDNMATYRDDLPDTRNISMEVLENEFVSLFHIERLDGYVGYRRS